MLQNNHFSEGPRQAYRLCFCYFQFTTQKVSKTQAICSPGRSERYLPGGYVGATIIHQEGYASREGGGSAIGWMPALFLCPKCGSQSIGLVPKRTIPLGGMVALGPFPQEEWFPCCSHGTQKKPRNRPRGSQMRPNIVPTYQKRPTRDPVVTKSAPVRKKPPKRVGGSAPHINIICTYLI